MLGTIVAIAIAYWFYKSAEHANKNPLKTGAVGFLAFLIPGIVWTLAVTPGLRDAVQHNPGALSVILAKYAYIMVGALCAVGIKFLYFKNN